MANRGRRLGIVAAMPILFGAISLFNVMSRPRFQGIRSLDAFQLITAGVCFGVGFVALVALIRGRETL